MLEKMVERKLKWLEGFGFEVLKLQTPGYNGTKDRIILWPKWAPAPPIFVEIKRPGQEERSLQAAVRDDWRARGCDVRDMCDNFDKVQILCDTLLIDAVRRYAVGPQLATGERLPPHIIDGYSSAAMRQGVF